MEKIDTLANRRDLIELVPSVHLQAWPPFMTLGHSAAIKRCWERLFEDFLDCQFVLTDESDEILAVAHTVSAPWFDEMKQRPFGWDEILTLSIAHFPKPTNVTVPLSIAILPEARGRSLGKTLVGAMQKLARQKNHAFMAGALRPNGKHRFPGMSLTEYLERKRPDGSPEDDWFRVHRRNGSQVVGVCEKSMHFEGTVEEWELWSGRDFEKTGDFSVEGALSLVHIDIEQNMGTYIEPNVWMFSELN